MRVEGEVDFDIKSYKETAWTPELGGEFGQFQLQIQMRTPQMKQKLLASALRDDYTVNAQIIAEKAIDTALDLVVGWKGAKQAYSVEVRDKGLVHMLDKPTGITIGGTNEPATLRQYVAWFAGEPEHFLAG